MTALGVQIVELKREVDLLLEGDDNRRIVDEYESAVAELEPTYESLESAIADRQTLLTSPTSFPLSKCTLEEDSISLRMRRGYESLVEMWKVDPTRVRQSGAVAELCAAAVAYQQCVTRNNTTTWVAWREGLEKQFLIADAQLESVKHVLDYAENIARYRQGVEKFAVLSRHIPNGEAAVSEISTLAESLRTIKSGMVFDLPPNVLTFFGTLDRDGHFPLGGLSREVSAWLLENDGMKDLSIVRRRVARR